jgi:hypothetical protein
LREASKQLAELLGCEARVASDASHRASVYWIMPRNCQDPSTVCQHDVLALPDNPESCLFERLDGSQMRDARNLRHS